MGIYIYPRHSTSHVVVEMQLAMRRGTVEIFYTSQAQPSFSHMVLNGLASAVNLRIDPLQVRV